eukprot:328915_1
MSTLEVLDNLLGSLQQKSEEKKDEIDDSMRITPEILNKCIDLKEYRDKNKYPYINVLPTTIPSKEYRIFENTLIKNKRIFLNDYKKTNKFPFSNVSELKDLFKPIMASNPIRDKNNCKCIEYKGVNGVKCHWIEYLGSNISNGVILVFHGAAYVMEENWTFAECELLSQLTGMICIAVSYKKAPKYPLPTPINDSVAVYNHFINDIKTSPSNIVLIGDSSGGGLVLLTLQQLNKSGIELPSCAILQSPWCYLNYDAQNVNDITQLNSKRSNYEYDANLNYPIINICAKMALGKMDENLNEKSRDNKLVQMIDNNPNIYNPICNDFKGLKNVAMYFMVGATEAILDDTLDAANKAYNEGCMNIRCDIYAYMLHCWMVFVGKFVEADYTVVKMADFILKNIGYQQSIPKSEYEPDPGQIISV